MEREIERLPDDYLYENSAENLYFYLYAKDTGLPLDLGAGSTVKWCLTKYNQKGYKTDLSKVAALSTDASGRTQARVRLTEEDTKGMVGSYLQQITVCDEAGNHVVAQGHLTFFVNIDVN